MAARKTWPTLRPAAERFADNFAVDDSGCWLWIAGQHGNGYGVFYVGNRKQVLAHRWSLEQSLGRPLAPGMHVLHSCDVPACVNPDHLREGTHAENMAEAAERNRMVKKSEVITHCSKGHEFTQENARTSIRRFKDGREYPIRKCRECNRAQSATYRQNRKNAA